MHGISHLLSHHGSHNVDSRTSHHHDSKSSSSSSSSDTRHHDTKILQDLLSQKHDGKLHFHERRVSRGSVSSTYSYGSSTSYGSSHGSNSSNYGSSNYPFHGIHHHSVYHTIHGNSHHHQSSHHHHPLHHLHHLHQPQGYSGRASPTSPSPTSDQEKQQHHHHHHHHHSIQEMIRHFGRRLGHIRRQSECQETPKKKGEDFRNRSQSLDGGARHPTLQEADCETTYRIYESILSQGAHRRSSLDPGTRRLSLGTPAVPHRASDACLDPVHAAILFRDARGLPVVDPFLEKVSLSDLVSGRPDLPRLGILLNCIS